ncbi:MAG: membrane lipoprotein lipid attachment site-containing protein [Chitinophaga sp.]|uniref:lipoprotein n=1 Tax=Chitinophaga sp. TaxID=1869181 RepID=UPI001AFDD743|nr:lipoprotein [Chitinophaga sp.]MBO9728019.1 membrane lipoprotein lipid attachment site-containing protein [Chitinophaga sp.]
MKRIFFVLTAALVLSSCFKDPPTVSAYMWYKETLCNDPWGKALTTKSDTVAAWLTKQNIKFEYVTIQGEIFQGAANVTKCDTFTNRLISAHILYADTTKATAAGFRSR